MLQRIVDCGTDVLVLVVVHAAPCFIELLYYSIPVEYVKRGNPEFSGLSMAQIVQRLVPKSSFANHSRNTHGAGPADLLDAALYR